MAELFTLPARATDSNNATLSGAKLYFYATGTTTPQAVYSSSAMDTPLSNPVEADSGGKFPAIYLDPALTYRGVCKSADDSQTIYDIDPVGSGFYGAFAGDGGSALVGFLQSGTGATARTVQAKLRETISVKDFGAVGDGVTNDTVALQAAIDYVETLGGGDVALPAGNYRIQSTLNIDGGSGVRLIGAGGDGVHDAGTGATAATQLLWYGAAGGTVINVASPSGVGNSRQFGSGVRDLKIDCRSIAGIGLLVNSVRNGDFARLTIYNPTIAGVKTTTLGNANLAESSDTQRCVLDRVSVRAIDSVASRAAHGFWLTSHDPAASNANTSLNLFSMCDAQMWGGAGSGHGLLLEDGDNNTFMNLRVSRASGTTVEAVRIVGNTSCDANHFWNLSAGGTNSITIRGTASGFAINPTKNSFWATDAGNGTQYPTADAGVIFTWHADTNAFVKLLLSQAVLADSEARARTELANLGNETARIFNGSSNHVVLTNGTELWSVAINGANGDLRMVRLAGSGAVDVGAGSPVKIGGKLVTEGAADSGGAGFRVLRVPN